MNKKHIKLDYDNQMIQIFEQLDTDGNGVIE
jgi:hypothetical protein